MGERKQKNQKTKSNKASDRAERIRTDMEKITSSLEIHNRKGRSKGKMGGKLEAQLNDKAEIKNAHTGRKR